MNSKSRRIVAADLRDSIAARVADTRDRSLLCHQELQSPRQLEEQSKDSRRIHDGERFLWSSGRGWLERAHSLNPFYLDLGFFFAES